MKRSNSYAYSVKLFLLWKFYHISHVSFHTLSFYQYSLSLNHSELFLSPSLNSIQKLTKVRAAALQRCIGKPAMQMHQAHQMRSPKNCSRPISPFANHKRLLTIFLHYPKFETQFSCCSQRCNAILCAILICIQKFVAFNFHVNL